MIPRYCGSLGGRHCALDTVRSLVWLRPRGRRSIFRYLWCSGANANERLGAFDCAKGFHFNARLFFERLDYRRRVLLFEAERNG
jgi:hypothetical protein